MNKKEALKKVKGFGELLSDLPVKFKKDIDVVNEAIKKDGYCIKFAHKDLKKNYKIVLNAVKAISSPEVIKFIDKRFKKNKKIILTAVKKKGGALKYADKSLKKNREIVLAAVKEEKKRKFDDYGNALKYADKTLRKNKVIVLNSVKRDGFSLQYADKSLKKNKEVVLAAIKEHGASIKFADISLKKNKDICIAAIKEYGDAIKYLDESLKKDKDFALYAIKNCSALVSNVHENLKKDKKFALEVVSHEGWQLASLDYFKRDKDIVLAAVSNFGGALEFADKTLKGNKQIVLAAVKNDGWSIKFANEYLKKDKDIIESAIKENPTSQRYLPLPKKHQPKTTFSYLKENIDFEKLLSGMEYPDLESDLIREVLLSSSLIQVLDYRSFDDLHEKEFEELAKLYKKIKGSKFIKVLQKLVFEGTLLPKLSSKFKTVIYFEMRDQSHSLIYSNFNKKYYYIWVNKDWNKKKNIPTDDLLDNCILDLIEKKLDKKEFFELILKHQEGAEGRFMEENKLIEYEQRERLWIDGTYTSSNGINYFDLYENGKL
jgi:hypothetical protein|tara:strand:+ start:122 stop:1756 length:1635 start_codon:yes stop_codon:yes gene_type:complete